MMFCVFYHLACEEGYFGTNCSRKCSPHCKPDTCRHKDGSCTCTAGWMGNNCTSGNFIIIKEDPIFKISVEDRSVLLKC